MGLTTNAWMMLSGAAMILFAIWLIWRSTRHDLKNSLIDSAWAVLLGRRTSENPTDIEKRIGEISAQHTHGGKARIAIRALIATLAAAAAEAVSTVLVMVGIFLIALGWYWT